MRDLGSFTLKNEGQTYRVAVPRGYKKVELTFYRGTPDNITLNAAWKARLLLNGREAVLFRGRVGGEETTEFLNAISNTTYKSTTDQKYIDVTPLIKPGNNVVEYYHEQRRDTPMGVILRVYKSARRLHRWG